MEAGLCRPRKRPDKMSWRSPLAGRNFGRYRVIRKLAEGGMGIIFLAHDDDIGRDVVIKSIKVGARPSFVDRIRLEAKALGALDHNHIATIYDIGRDDAGLPYIVMELIHGQTIEALLEEKGKLSPEKGVRLATMIARALHYAHSAGVLHCDLTATNVIVTEGLQPKIMDFGIARWQTEDTTSEPGRIYGTAAYMSPEQTKGLPLDPRTDVFSLGVVTYQLLSGKRPFGDSGYRVVDMMVAIQIEDPPPLSEISAQVDTNLEAVIMKALAKDRENRFRTADELADSLEHYLISPKEEERARDNDSKRNAFKSLRGLFTTLFYDFSDEELREIISISSDRKYPAHDTIIEEGATDATLYLICQGDVSVRQKWNESTKEVKKLGPGECFGEMTFVSKRPRFASIVARTDTRVIAINETRLVDLKRKVAAKLHRALASIISEKLRISDKTCRELEDQLVQQKQEYEGLLHGSVRGIV
jgi:serine/threonine protein kinase